MPKTKFVKYKHGTQKKGLDKLYERQERLKKEYARRELVKMIVGTAQKRSGFNITKYSVNKAGTGEVRMSVNGKDAGVKF